MSWFSAWCQFQTMIQKEEFRVEYVNLAELKILRLEVRDEARSHVAKFQKGGCAVKEL